MTLLAMERPSGLWGPGTTKKHTQNNTSSTCARSSWRECRVIGYTSYHKHHHPNIIKLLHNHQTSSYNYNHQSCLIHIIHTTHTYPPNPSLIWPSPQIYHHIQHIIISILIFNTLCSATTEYTLPHTQPSHLTTHNPSLIISPSPSHIH
jgi:hypothetical protein